MVNGVTVNENLRGQAERPLHRGRDSGDDGRDGGISAEYGRFSGGVVNVDHQVGRQHVQRLVPRHAEQRQLAELTPFEDTSIAADPVAQGHRGSTTSSRPTSTPSAVRCEGSAVVLHRRAASDAGGTAARWSITNIPYDFTRPTRATRSRARTRSTRTIGSRATTSRSSTSRSTTPSDRRCRWIVNSLGRPRRRRRICSRSTTAACSRRSCSSKRCYSRRHFSFIGSGAKSTDLDRRHAADRPRPRQLPLLVADLLRRLHAGAARQRGHLRQGLVLPVDQPAPARTT